MKLWIARKHPLQPFNGWGHCGYLEAFTIAAVFASREEAKAFVKDKMSRSSKYLYTVGKVELEAAK